jgi:hypothetical protein
MTIITVFLINNITLRQKKINCTVIHTTHQQQHTNILKHDKKEHANITLFISLIFSYVRGLREICLLREYFCFFLKFVSMVTLRFLLNYI